MGVVGVFGGEEGAEFGVAEVAVSVNIVSLENKLNVLNLREQANSRKSVSKFLKTAPAPSTEIKHSETIHQVKVWFQSKLSLDCL